MRKTLTLCCVLILTVSASFALNKCVHRSFGKRWTVCVCNATYCDSLEPFVKTATGVVNQFVTSQDGDRMAKNVLHFVADQPAHDSHTISVSVDHTKQRQKIVGFGGAFTDATGINIAKMTKPIRERIIRDYYATDGLEYNLNRVPIGSADFSIRPYTYDDDAVDESLSKFALQFEDHLFKIPYMKLAQQVSPHKQKHFGSNWGPPAWMKTNNKINNGGHLRGEAGGKYYKLFAKYLIKFVQEYAKEGVPIWGLTVENEPAQNAPDFSWGSLFFNSTMERDFIKLDLGPELHAAGLTEDKLKVIAYDDSLFKIKDFVSTVLSDKDAAKYVSGSAYHWYENNKSNYSDLDYLYEKYPGKLLLSTESCLGFGRDDFGVEWQFFLYASDIIRAMNHYVSGYTDWNLAVDFNGGPNWANFTANAPIVVNPMIHEYYKQPFYYALGHFSKFVVPDSVCIEHNVPNLPKGIMMAAFERPDNGTVLTIMNENWGGPIDVQVHDPKRGYFNVKVKPESLETFIWY